MSPDVATVERLTEDMTGRWLVTTQGSTHLWDLDAMTYERRPGPDSHAGPFLYDGRPHPITRVEKWPEIGGQSFIWFDDPEMPDLFERFRRSSIITKIEKEES